MKKTAVEIPQLSSAVLFYELMSLKATAPCASNDIAFPAPLLEARVVAERWAHHHGLPDGEIPSLCGAIRHAACHHVIPPAAFDPPQNMNCLMENTQMRSSNLQTWI